MLKGIELFKPIAELPMSRIDQDLGQYSNKTPCCVGAHLAYHLDIGLWDHEDYLRGADAWAEAMGVTRAHVILLLKAAGAGKDPLSSTAWKLSPAEVYQNLLKIEEFPTLIGTDLREIHLETADLQSQDFTDANLKYANLDCANLESANLTRANLSCTFAPKINLKNANLQDANLSGANFRRANLQGANLKGANLEGINLTGATLPDNLSDIDLTEAFLA